jgi:cytochrome c556
MRKPWIVGGSAALALVVLAAAWGYSQQPNRVAAFMRLKLQHAQNALAGLAVADYEAIARAGQQISLLTQDAQWQVLQTPDYLRNSIEFRHAADRLTKAGREKNLDAATLAYVELTMRCVNCHKHVRDVKMAELPPPRRR